MSLTVAKKKSKRAALIYKPSLKCFLCSKWCFRTFWLHHPCPQRWSLKCLKLCAEAQYVLIFGAFVSHFICTESCAIVIQWFTLCSQNTHSYLLRDCGDAVRQLWVGGRVGDGETERWRETLALYLVLWEMTLLSSFTLHGAREHQELQILHIHAGGILPCVGSEALQR